jgi:NAD(P)-dependent dehydrogenase (short-subunit alcohol dehydrogenase family)
MTRRRTPGPGDLHGTTAVVTGAARGLGAAVALSLADRGARVALIGLEAEELEATAAQCAQRSPAQAGQHAMARAWTADVTDRERMAAVGTEVADWLGSIDLVVANAGIAIGGPFADSDPAAFDRVIEVNLIGSAGTARAFLPALVASKGYFLQVASLAAVVPAPLMAAYSASKAGAEAFAHALRAEVAHQGVGVGVAYLSWTDTDMLRAADQDDALRQMRARLPWPANRTAPLDPAVERIIAGITRRSTHIYAQRWIRSLQWLPRLTVPNAAARRGSREVARLEDALRSTASERLMPLGPGGHAAATARPAAGQPAGGAAERP